MAIEHTSRIATMLMTTALVVLAQQKVFPGNTDREWRCPNAVKDDNIPPGYNLAIDNLNDVIPINNLSAAVAGTALWDNAAVILVKRKADGTPYYKYYGNGHENFAIETWSSSKIFSAMNGAGRLSEDCQGNCSDPGLPQSTSGDYGTTPLGDLITIIVTYDTTHPPYSSNALGGWFEMVGGRDRAVNLIQEWMKRPNETLGANYGAPPPSDLIFTFQPGNCTIQPDTPHNGNHSNTLSALTAAEMLRRIVTFRESDVAQRFPNTTWNDSKVLLYGAEESLLFPHRIWGGMSAINDDMVRNGINIKEVEARSNGTWRTFGKDGGGYSEIRDAGEALFNGYACYPSVEDPSEGVEYFVSARISIPRDYHAAKAYGEMQRAMGALNRAIYTHQLE